MRGAQEAETKCEENESLRRALFALHILTYRPVGGGSEDPPLRKAGQLRS